MVTLEEYCALAESFPGAEEGDGPSFSVNGRAFAWAWRERVHPKKTKVPRPERPVVPVASLDDKEALVQGEPDAFFTEPHYDGYKAVIVRLEAIDPARLREVLEDAHTLAVAAGPPKPRKRTV
jgi:hypothetical protein